MNKRVIVGVAMAIAMSVMNAFAEGSKDFTGGNTWYVDASAAAGGDGGDASPFNTIDAAISAAVSGDKIEIAAGCYVSTNATTTLGRTNIYIDGKKLWLCGAGRTATYIIGQHDATGTGGVGADAVRCVTITGAGAAGSIFEKMTFLKGATASGSAYGGVYADSKATGVIFVDCTFRQCASDTLAGAAGGANEKFIRCLFDGNWCSTDYCGAAIDGSIAGCYNCIFFRNIHTGTYGHTLGKNVTSNFVNCDFIGNESKAIPQDNNYGKHYNCVFLSCRKKSSHTSNVAPTRSGMTVFYSTTDMSAGTLPGNPWSTYQNHNTSTSIVDNVTYYSHTNTAFCVFSPLTFKFNPTPESPLVASGNAAYVGGNSNKIAWVPDEYVNYDYEGNARFTNGTICRGAVETTKDSESAPVRPDVGMTLANYEGSDIYVDRVLWYRSEGYPSAEYLTATGGAVFAISRINAGDAMTLAPDGNIGIWQLAKPKSTVSVPVSDATSTNQDKMKSGNDCGAIEVTANMATDVKWADPKLTDYSGANGSKDKPYETLQAAVNACAAKGVVYAKRGTYDKGETYVSEYGSNRVVIAKQIRIVGVEGAKNTIIKGAFNEDASNNRTGAKSVRGVYATTTAHSSVCGFTITGCSTQRATDDSVNAKWAGAAVLSTSRNALQVADCIISNNYSLTSPATYMAWVQRSFITDNHQENMVNDEEKLTYNHRGSVGCRTTLSSCLVLAYTHTGRTATLGEYSEVYGCTIRGSTSNRTMDDASPTRFNTIFYDSGCGDGQAAQATAYGWPTDLTWKEILTGFSSKTLNADPLFADVENDDYRLMTLSPAVAIGGNCTRYNTYTVGTIDGYSPILDGNKTLIGCYGETVPCYAAGQNVSPSGTNAILTAESIEFTGKRNRPIIGFKVMRNGVETTIAPTSYRKYVFDPSDLEGGCEYVNDVVYGTNWYVNATSGNDTTGDGQSADTPMMTLAGIFGDSSKCEILSGDCVHAAEGVYNEGTMLNSPKGSYRYCGVENRADMYSRVLVPDGVTLKADGERDKTIILGQWQSDTCSYGPVYDGSTVVYPATPNNTIRGVALGHGSILDGFVVSNGCATASSGGMRDDNIGGGIIGYRAVDSGGPSYVRNCTITGSGERNGAVYGCILENCYLYKNCSSSDGSSCVASRLIDCLVINSQNSAFNGHYGIYNSTIYSTTYTLVNVDLKPSSSDAQIVNSILLMQFYPGSKYGTNTLKNIKNCVLWPATTANYAASAANIYVDPATCENVITQNLAWCKLDANNYYQPLSGSPVIDAGDKSLVANMEAVLRGDFSGNQRIYNGKIDIGASEYDWRGDFAKTLRYSKLSVAKATENVVKSENEQSLSFAHDERIVVGIKGYAGVFANFEIPNDGTLSLIDADGNTFATLDSSVNTYEIEGRDSVEFAYTGEGTVTLLPFTSNLGLMIYIK